MQPTPSLQNPANRKDELPGAIAAHLLRRAGESGVFGAVRMEGGRVVCEAKASAEPAWYAAGVEGGRVWISLETPARYLSQSIEQDLVHTGDKLEELLEEELVDLGIEAVGGRARLAFEHFRNEAKVFVFRSPVMGMDETTGANAAERLAVTLLGYEQCFRRLGDMEGGDED